MPPADPNRPFCSSFVSSFHFTSYVHYQISGPSFPDVQVCLALRDVLSGAAGRAAVEKRAVVWSGLARPARPRGPPALLGNASSHLSTTQRSADLSVPIFLFLDEQTLPKWQSAYVKFQVSGEPFIYGRIAFVSRGNTFLSFKKVGTSFAV